jgi:hypothetical protein
VGAVSKVRGARFSPAVDAWLVARAAERGVSLSVVLREAVLVWVAAEGGPVGSLGDGRREPVSGRAAVSGGSPVSRAELFAGLRVPVSVRGRRASSGE